MNTPGKPLKIVVSVAVTAIRVRADVPYFFGRDLFPDGVRLPAGLPFGLGRQ